MKQKRLTILFGILTVLMIAFIWGNSIQSRAQSTEQSSAVLRWLQPLLGGLDEELQQIIVRKTAHFAEFAALGLCVGGFTVNLGRLQGKRYISLPMLMTLGVAVMDEFIQLFSGRGSLVGDVVLDYCGSLTGLAFVALVCWITNRKGKEG